MILALALVVVLGAVLWAWPRRSAAGPAPFNAVPRRSAVSPAPVDTDDRLDAAITNIEYDALVRRLALGAKKTLNALPPEVKPLVHLRNGPRAACTPHQTGINAKGNPWTVWEEDAAAELTAIEAAVTCEKCRTRLTGS